jgi:nicotinamidase-related amidase
MANLGNWRHLCIDMQRIFAEQTPRHVGWMDAVLPQVEELADDFRIRQSSRVSFRKWGEDMPGAWQEYYRKWWMLTRRHMPAEMADLVQPLARLVPPARTFDKRTYFPWIEGGISVWRLTTWRWRAKALTVERRDDHVAGPHCDPQFATRSRIPHKLPRRLS